MEVVPKRASIVKEEKKIGSCGDSDDVVGKIGTEKKTGEGGFLKSSSPNQRDSRTNNQVSIVIASERLSMDASSRPSPSNTRGPTSITQEDQLESTKAEMGEVREENERLKTLLARIVKDYQSLQMHFFDIVQQDQSKKAADTSQPAPRDGEEPDQLVSLSLGTNASVHKKEEKANTASKSKDNDQIEEGLTLGLDCKYEGSSNGTNEPASNNMSPSNSIEETKEEEVGEPWPPSKILKNLRNGPEDEGSQQAHVKKTRVSVRARCDAPTMHDGCQWRKYGQKIAKGNPCPRAYYRCTVAPACPVRKQVQRCAEDMSILITTYEGTHNHPLPVSATAMASTTSAAAYMLMSGSSTSRPPAIGSLPSSSSLPAATASTFSSSNPNLHALNFNLTDPNLQSLPLFYLPNSSISSTPSYPTITLDLTSPPQVPSQASQFTRFPSYNFNTSSATRHSTGFNFSSPESSATTSWANSPYSSYQQPYNKSPIGYLGFSASKQQDNLYQSYLERVVNPVGVPVATQHVLTDTIAKAITSDPSFQSVLAAAITSYVGGGTGAAQNGGEGASLGSLAPYLSTPATVNGCGSSFLTRTTSGSASSTQQGSSGLKFLQPPPLAFSSSKSASTSPVDNRENIN